MKSETLWDEMGLKELVVLFVINIDEDVGSVQEEDDEDEREDWKEQ